MQPIKDILQRRDPAKGHHAKYEWQAYGYDLARQLSDLEHRSLYMKLAKGERRELLEETLEFVKGAQPKNKAKLFMWKLGQLRKEARSD